MGFLGSLAAISCLC